MTALDYIDHIISRLELDPKNVDLMDLKKRAETIIVLATTEYQFSYLSPSLLAASAIYTALKCLSLIRKDLQIGAFKNLKEIRQRLQSATHCAQVIFCLNFYLNLTIIVPYCHKLINSYSFNLQKDIELCMKNLLPIVPSYLLEFPLPTLSRLSNSLSSKSYENIPTLTTTNNMVMLSSGKTTSTSSLPNPEIYSSYSFDQAQCTSLWKG